MKNRFDSYREILGYEVESEKIKIYYKDGTKSTVSYSKEKEIEILQNMKQELINCDYINTNKHLIGLNSIAAPLSLTAAIMQGTLCISGAIAGDFDLSNLFLLISNSMLFLPNAFKLIIFGLNANDIKKGNLFIENEHILNKMIETNVETLENKMAPSRELELYEELGSPKLTLNNIDDIPLRKLKKIVKYIKEDDALGIASSKAFYETITSLEKVKKKNK